MFKLTASALAAIGFAALAAPASFADEVIVKMLDNGSGGMMVFEPAAAKLKTGDTVRFVPTNPGHNVESIKTMLPAGAPVVKSAMGKEVAIVFDKPGTYGIKCPPHYGMGMIFVAKVGDGQPNFVDAKAAAEKAPSRIKKRFEEAFKNLE